MVATSLSPLAPAGFPELPAIAGVKLHTATLGIRYKGRPDVLFAELEPGTQVAGVFTTSTTASAAVRWGREALKGGTARAFFVNAGNSVAFTGKAGEKFVADKVESAAKALGCAKNEIFTASTGVIGEPTTATRITDALDDILANDAGWLDAAKAIMTTDTFPKGASATATINGTKVTIAGIAKGSGMIEPNMATMLGFVFTDAALPHSVLQALLSDCNNRSFNAITVDSDTSTSDTLLLAATGKAGNDTVSDANDPAIAEFKDALEGVLRDLAHQIVRDGEGASKFITVNVTGAVNEKEAKIAAKAIANSPLVKTAIAGEDANWGRIVMAVGKCGVTADPNKLTVSIGGIELAKNGERVADYDEGPVEAHIKGQYIDIAADLGFGDGAATVWTCDLTHGYISINADYRS
ncbi:MULTISPECIES: bifunctional glutamate N-acetyltransferase/amino-acid acetyltransferase ArgJ [unclassified Thalassospira]|uniref:bifunctional glutamate N-acetyltransferase/amino-acid acetyltransferase ArgJ n=1 Tax=unclassified Thalassospira TaxID=2648997 RepID=UPI001B0C7A6A|nr:bifunctional glutamate N-acetyltransferase/amino-acid acetyltransferase ArgJ [Thalassospira sp.]MBO6769995.1 bifunctional glutamate N-acetyltransferase/amino-acid acetyltransferase ArgJ [Thalassospira sp.]